MFSPMSTTAFRLTPFTPHSPLPERVRRTIKPKRRKVELGELLARLYASDLYQCYRAQGRRMAAHALRQAVIARWSLS